MDKKEEIQYWIDERDAIYSKFAVLEGKFADYKKNNPDRQALVDLQKKFDKYREETESSVVNSNFALTELVECLEEMYWLIDHLKQENDKKGLKYATQLNNTLATVLSCLCN